MGNKITSKKRISKRQLRKLRKAISASRPRSKGLFTAKCTVEQHSEATSGTSGFETVSCDYIIEIDDNLQIAATYESKKRNDMAGVCRSGDPGDPGEPGTSAEPVETVYLPTDYRLADLENVTCSASDTQHGQTNVDSSRNTELVNHINKAFPNVGIVSISKDAELELNKDAMAAGQPLSEWLQLMCRDDLSNKSNNSTSYRVCENHFKKQDILPTPNRKILKKNSLPSLNLPDLQRTVQGGLQRDAKETQDTLIGLQNCTRTETATDESNVRLDRVKSEPEEMTEMATAQQLQEGRVLTWMYGQPQGQVCTPDGDGSHSSPSLPVITTTRTLKRSRSEDYEEPPGFPSDHYEESPRSPQFVSLPGPCKTERSDSLVSGQTHYDEFDHFGLMIASKVRRIDDFKEREAVMNMIQNVVFQSVMKSRPAELPPTPSERDACAPETGDRLS